jgi:HlyD family secretion protein
MKVSMSASPAQSRQIKQQLAMPEESLSYELGKAVQELPPMYTRILSGAIGAFTLGTLAWAQFSQVEEVAVTQGKLLPSSEVRPIRATNIGGVSKALVKEGDTVSKDQVLIELDPGASETSVEGLEKEVAKLKSEITRLEVEDKGGVGSGTVDEQRLNDARRLELATKQQSALSEAARKKEAINEQISRRDRIVEAKRAAESNQRSAEAAFQQAEAALNSAKEGLAQSQERADRYSKLENTGAVSNVNVIDARERLASANQAVAQAEQQKINAQNAIEQAASEAVSMQDEMQAQESRITQAEQDFQSSASSVQTILPQRQSEVLTQLNQRRTDLTTKQAELEVAKKQKSEREVVKAPFDGTVYNVKVTQGPVQQGEELLSILPKDEELIMEVKVLNQDIGFVQPKLNPEGQPLRAKVKLSAFPYQEYSVIEGEVISVSPDAVVERDENGRELGPVFLAKVKLAKSSVRVRDKVVDLTPGMTGTADIVTRKKSILSFLIEPVTRKFDEAFSAR